MQDRPLTRIRYEANYGFWRADAFIDNGWVEMNIGLTRWGCKLGLAYRLWLIARHGDEVSWW